jgi:DNA-binding transcriptional ArsR family regulator
MVNYSAATLDATFAALADPTRRAILAKLATTPDASVSELASPFRMSLPAVSKHLRVLESAGLLERRRAGRVHHCRFVPGPMRTASDWIAHYERFWTERLEALKRYLEQSLEDEEEEPWPNRETKPQPRRRAGRPASRARSRRRGRESSGRGRTPSS